MHVFFYIVHWVYALPPLPPLLRAAQNFLIDTATLLLSPTTLVHSIKASDATVALLKVHSLSPLGRPAICVPTNTSFL